MNTLTQISKISQTEYFDCVKEEASTPVFLSQLQLEYSEKIVISSGATERGKSKYLVRFGKKQIGIIVHSSTDCFAAALSLLFGEGAETFCDRESALSWLVARYLDWRNLPISIDWENNFYVVRHGYQYIGNIYFSEEHIRWVATIDSPHSKFDSYKSRTFEQAKKVIVKAHLG